MTANNLCNIFDQWNVNSEDNLDLEEIKARFVDFTVKLEEAAGRLDNYYKIMLLSQNIQMVIGGLKPVASLTIDKVLVEEYLRKGLLKDFDLAPLGAAMNGIFNLRVSEKLDGYDGNKFDFYVYNPKMISGLSNKFPKLSPYNGQSLNLWIKENSHVPTDYLNGIIFGYPISAVKQFLKYQNQQECRLDNRKVVNNYGEAYIVWGDAHKRDVQVREALKETFFTNLATSDEYVALCNRLQAIAEEYRQVSQYSFEKMLTYYPNLRSR